MNGPSCPCGAPVQDAEDHVCGECATHCRLDAHRRETARQRATEQAQEDARLERLHASQIAVPVAA